MEQTFVLRHAVTFTCTLIVLQGLVMFIDEFYYHRRRGLGNFEWRGHVVDSLVFLAALALPALTLPVARNFMLYILLGTASSLIITKDEWVHARACKAGEHWLHSILFVLHAPILICIGFIWINDQAAPLLWLVPSIVGAWTIYQFAHWRVRNAKIHTVVPTSDK